MFIHEHVQLGHQASSAKEPVRLLKKPESEVTWRLKRFIRAQSGQGEYLKFWPMRNSKDEKNAVAKTGMRVPNPVKCEPSYVPSSALEPALLCPLSKLSARWGSVLGFEALDMNPLGGWLKAAWLCMGEDDYLDLASEYALKSVITFQRHDKRNLSQAYAAGESALRSLQVAINVGTGQDEDRTTNLIVTVMLHYAAEVSVLAIGRAETLLNRISTSLD